MIDINFNRLNSAMMNNNGLSQTQTNLFDNLTKSLQKAPPPVNMQDPASLYQAAQAAQQSGDVDLAMKYQRAAQQLEQTQKAEKEQERMQKEKALGQGGQAAIGVMQHELRKAVEAGDMERAAQIQESIVQTAGQTGLDATEFGDLLQSQEEKVWQRAGQVNDRKWKAEKMEWMREAQTEENAVKSVLAGGDVKKIPQRFQPAAEAALRKREISIANVNAIRDKGTEVPADVMTMLEKSDANALIKAAAERLKRGGGEAAQIRQDRERIAQWYTSVTDYATTNAQENQEKLAELGAATKVAFVADNLSSTEGFGSGGKQDIPEQLKDFGVDHPLYDEALEVAKQNPNATSHELVGILKNHFKEHEAKYNPKKEGAAASIDAAVEGLW